MIGASLFGIGGNRLPRYYCFAGDFPGQKNFIFFEAESLGSKTVRRLFVLWSAQSKPLEEFVDDRIGCVKSGELQEISVLVSCETNDPKRNLVIIVSILPGGEAVEGNFSLKRCA